MIPTKAVGLAAGFVLLAGAIVRPVAADVTAEQVRLAIDRARDFLLREQRADGGWPELQGYPGGVSALCTLALIHSGLPADHPAVAKALQYLRGVDHNRRTYSVSLITMALCAGEPERDRLLISRNVRTLESTQFTEGVSNGAWGYPDGLGDNSNSQFALLALHEAQRVGVDVQNSTWRRAERYWKDQQLPSGAWNYQPGRSETGSMTCAGITSLIITSGQIGQPDAAVQDGRVTCCLTQGDDSEIQRGIDWLARHFSVSTNPTISPMRNGFDEGLYYLYYMYAMERVGRLSGLRFIGQHDWYREGAEKLLQIEDRVRGGWNSGGSPGFTRHVSTAMGLLFLAKGRRPVLVSKLKYGTGGQWNQHRHDLAYLTAHVEKQWSQEMTWQTIDLSHATLVDLLQTPVLFISGREALALRPADTELLREYVEQGGFLFAEACCDAAEFDRDFRALMADLFPGSELHPLPPDHPVWYAQQPVDPEAMRPLLGLEACCRTSVVYCPADLSCYWELAGGQRQNAYPPDVQKDVAGCLAIGANVLTYATNRELKEKLDLPQIRSDGGPREAPGRAVLQVAKLDHGGGSNDAPGALRSVLDLVQERTLLAAVPSPDLVPLTSPELANYAVAFIHGRRNFQLSQQEREGLREFILHGGFLWGDAICASPQFHEAFRREVQLALPEFTWEPIPPDHPMFSTQFGGTDLARVEVREPQARGADGDPLVARTRSVPPQMEGLRVGERYAIVFSPLDLSCALENQASLECPGYVVKDAAGLAVNILFYGMQP